MPALARILDANANRAREALRVMEDAARFGLDDPALSAELKSMRHDLARELEAIGNAFPHADEAARLASRDTPGDVGTRLTAEGEYTRDGLRGVVVAAGKRLTEALRSIEECCKALADPSGDERGPSSARAFERLRYRAYACEPALIGRLTGRRDAAPQWSVCVLLSERLCRRPWREVATAALAGGADCVQLREKSMDGGELLARARWLVDAARSAGSAAVVINDRPDIALLAGAAGVHLGQSDIHVADARRLAQSSGQSLLIGVSTHTLEEALAAAGDPAGGVDYCGVGPMFETATKPQTERAGPAYLRAYLADSRTSRVPHLAIGGIDPDRARELAAMGCRGVAASSYVCAAADPGRAVAELKRAVAPEGMARPPRV
ncbi:MAG: thiamine phosphate synthase [Phycisphaerae bacterium]|nr:thiamine phosphate synthase [Phycisphaerae bacterium]